MIISVPDQFSDKEFFMGITGITAMINPKPNSKLHLKRIGEICLYIIFTGGYHIL